MHPMPSIVGVPDFRLWFGRKLEAKINLKISTHFTHESGSVVLQYWYPNSLKMFVLSSKRNSVKQIRIINELLQIVKF